MVQLDQSGFGDLLRELRKERGFTLSRLAEASGVSDGHLSKLEHGRKPPTVEMIGRLALGLEVDARILIERSGLLPNPVMERLLSPGEVRPEDFPLAIRGLAREISKLEAGGLPSHEVRAVQAAVTELLDESVARDAILEFTRGLLRPPSSPSANLDGSVERFDAAVDYFPDHVAPEYATRWRVRYERSYKVLTVSSEIERPGILHPDVYVLVQRGTPAPRLVGPLSGATVIEVPVRRVWHDEARLLGAIEFLEVSDALLGWAKCPSGIDHLGALSARVEEIVEESNLPGTEDERVAAIRGLEPDVYFYGLNHGWRRHRRASGLPTVFFLPAVEHPLACAEQLKFVSLFFNLESKANRQFAAIEARYRSLKRRARRSRQRPSVLIGHPNDRGTWDSFWPHWLLPGLGRDAGGVDVLGEAGITPHLNEAGTPGEVGLDEALAFGADADFWYSSIWETTTPGDAARRVYSQIAAAGRGAAFRRFRRGRDVLHTGGVRVDLMLADLIALMSPTVLPEYEPLFHERMGQP